MEPISSAERLVLILRQKLEERARASGKSRARERGQSVAPAEASGVRGLAAVEGTDSRNFRRAVVQQILADQIGPSLINDAQFQLVVTRVSDAIENDPDTAALLSRAIAEFKLA